MSLPERGQQGSRDRLSDLPDGVVGHILSFLPTKEAGRAAALAGSWRHKFAYVHTISFVEYVAPFRGDDYTFYLRAGDRPSKNGAFLDDVNAALLCRRRCAGDRNAAPRSFRAHFGGYYDWDGPVVSQWLCHLLRRSGPELYLDLRLQLTVTAEHYAGEPDHHGGEEDDRCPSLPYGSSDADMFTLPLGSIEAVTRILEQAPRIKILTLFMKPSKDVWVHPHELSDEKRVREINLVH
uniref:F-box domain-containing protein n=1 Tax=Aegilops tauschii TaxID=37682 RepID=R7W686_AEGTA